MNTSRRILIATCITCFVGPFMASSINVAIPTMASEFAMPATQLSWIITVFLLSTAATLLPCGKVSDTLGRRRSFMIGVVAFAIFTLGAACSPTVFLLTGFCAFQGVALSLVFASYLPLLLESHPSEQGKVIGISSASTYLGLSAGPFIGGILTQYVSWRAVFFFSFFALCFAYICMASIQEEWFGEQETMFDWAGSLLSMPAIVCTIYGLSVFNSILVGKYMFFTGLALIIVFLWHEKQISYPIVPLSLFHNLSFSMSNLASLAHYSATYAITFLLSFQLQLVLHLNAASTGFILLIHPITMSICSTRAGSLADRHEPRYIASMGMALTASCLFLFAFLPNISIALTILLLIFLGIGAALFVTPNTSAILTAAPEKQHSIASSVLALMRILGQAISMAVVSLIFAHTTMYLSNYEQAITQGVHWSFIILSFTCFIGIFASLARGSSNKGTACKAPSVQDDKKNI
jgi:MFS family permease